MPQNNFKFNLNQQPSYQRFRTNKEEAKDALIPSSKAEILFLMKFCFHSTNVIHCGCFSVIPEHLVAIYSQRPPSTCNLCDVAFK